jgi:hypothetical protein
VFHLSNGLWTMGITWGLWETAAAQRRANWVCGVFGVLLFTLGMGALFGAVRAGDKKNLLEAEAYEQARDEQNQQLEELEAKAKAELEQQGETKKSARRSAPQTTPVAQVEQQP